MASFLPNITDQGLQTMPFTPDFQQISNVLQTKESQYRQGEAEIASGYSAIANMQVTDQANVVKKQQYLKGVQDGLKKVATTDLSLGKNTAQAQQLYAPFYEDNYLLQDNAYTKYAQNQIGKLDGWSNSSEKDIRAMYDYDAVRYIQQGLSKLARANRDPENYKRLEKRDAIPAPNIDADVDAAWQKEQGSGRENGVSTVYTDGKGAMITQYNGIKSKDAYKTYYLSKMADGKYDAYIRMKASVKATDAKEAILVQNPGIDEKALNEHLAGDILGRLGTSTQKIAKSYADQATFWAKKKQDLVDQIKQNQKGIVAPEQEGNLVYYTRMMREYSNEADRYNKEYWNMYSPVTINNTPNPNYEKTYRGIATYPEDYIAGIEKDRMAENWAAGRASITSEKKEVDPLWAAYRDQANKDVEHQLTRRGQDITSRGQTLGWMEKTGTDMRGNRLPGFNPNRSSGWYGKIEEGEQSGVLNPLSGQITGNHTVEPSKLHIEDIQQAYSNLANSVAGQIFNPDPSGISGIALNQLGLSRGEIIDFTEAAKSQLSGSTQVSPKQLAVWNKVKAELQAHGIDMSDIHGPAGMQTAIIQYSSKVAEQLLHSDKQADVAEGNKLLAGYITAQTQRDTYLKSQQNLDKAMHNEIISNRKYEPLTYVDQSGKKQVMDAPTLAKLGKFPDIVVSDEEGKSKVITGSEMAQSYLNGTFEYGTLSDKITVDGKEYSLGKSYTIADYRAGNTNPPDGSATMFNRMSNWKRQNEQTGNWLPDSKKIKELRQEANEHVISGMQQYKNGVIYKEISYDPNASKKGDKGQEKFALNLAPELANPANTTEIYTYKNGDNDPITLNEDAPAIRSMLRNVDDTKDYVGSIVATRGKDGEKVWAIHFKSGNEKGHDIAENKKLNFYAGKTVYMKVSPNAQGSTMNAVPDNTGNYIYGDIYNGATYTSNALINNMGITYSVRGYEYGPDGRATKASVTITQKVKDPDHIGQFINKPTVDVTIPLTGPMGKTVDQVMDATLGTVASHGYENVNNNNMAHSKIKGRTIEEIEAHLNNQQ